MNSKTKSAVNKAEIKNTTKSSKSVVVETDVEEPISITTTKPNDSVIKTTYPVNIQHGFFSGSSNPYKEYIKSLDYLNKLEFDLYTEKTEADVVIEREELFNAWDK